MPCPECQHALTPDERVLSDGYRAFLDWLIPTHASEAERVLVFHDPHTGVKVYAERW